MEEKAKRRAALGGRRWNQCWTRWRWRRWTLWCLVWCCVPLAIGQSARIGLPLSHSFSLDELKLARGARFALDANGRLLVFGESELLVFNDNSWAPLEGSRGHMPRLHSLLATRDGRIHFGSLAEWGYLEPSKWRTFTVELPGPDMELPQWQYATTFSDILEVGGAICFVGGGGVVCRDMQTGAHRFCEVPTLTHAFVFEGKLYASSFSEGLLVIDPQTGGITGAPLADLRYVPLIAASTRTASGRLILSNVTHDLFTFDGRHFLPWGAPEGAINGRITHLEALHEGGVVVAVQDQGLFLLTDDGVLQRSFQAAEFRQIYDLISPEPGVLWVSTNDGITKLLYGLPVTSIDERSNVRVEWPKIIALDGRVHIASNGELYIQHGGNESAVPSFRRETGRPAEGVYSIASSGADILIGNGRGVTLYRGGRFIPLIIGLNTGDLQMITPDRCLVMGADEIALLERRDGEWREAVPRARGKGFPYITHRVGEAVFVELGQTRIARIAVEDGGIVATAFENFPWEPTAWLNVGTFDQFVVVSGPNGQRQYFRTDPFAPCAPPAMEAFLASIPEGALRVQESPSGEIWVTHENGAFHVSRRNGTYVRDRGSFDLVRVSDPLLYFTEGEEVWITNEYSIYRLDPTQVPLLENGATPRLTSVSENRTGQFLYRAESTSSPGSLGRVPFTANHLTFEFFSGGYGYLRPLVYRFTMSSSRGDWTLESSSPELTLPNLREGRYRLTATVLHAPSPAQERSVAVGFEIRPPAYRSPWAYAAYVAMTLGAGVFLMSWVTRTARRQNEVLEGLVASRTRELRETMEQLKVETQTAATLNERNRLASEIHDSLQQSLSGLYLHLDGMLKEGGLTPVSSNDVELAKRMVAYSRQELQQTIRDLESPLLENATLAEALRRQVEIHDPEARLIEFMAPETEPEVPERVRHEFLRIAQEAIGNALKHSQCRRIEVRLESADGALVLTVADDGRGFDDRQVMQRSSSHLGLRGIRQRARRVGAAFDLSSSPREGSRITVTFPTPPPA